MAVPFRSSEAFDEHAIANVFCPVCSDRAPSEAFMVAVTGVPGWSGVYGIDWNQSYLRERAPGFRDTFAYYRKLFEKGDVSFGFLPKVGAGRAFDVLGIKGSLPSEADPAGRAGRVIADESAGWWNPRGASAGSGRNAKVRPRGLGR